ncbi:7218_t:CDS:2 [Diversispora eburnea]|uniref:7218_t:CDS:1 n=1 Tax=Diversispora eburnea TaxID=1213867 RepID=A0A9N8V9M8_9GLOM|nr:7218_t:CDS:2 [Diversispora eburnea]
MVKSPVLTSSIPSMRIPDSVNPPIPGESHRYYGNIHIKQVKLPSNNQSLRGTSTNSTKYSDANGSTEGDLDIHDATAVGKMDRVKALLDPRGSGETTSSFLLANEASSSSGLTPLHYAASRGHLEIVKWLIDAAGAITALLKASYNGHHHVVAFLLAKQANVHQEDNDGWTALHNASARGHLKIVKYLLEHTEADVDVKSAKGHTPLMNAASKGHIDIVECLLQRWQANPLIKNSFGETAYDVAAISQEFYICEILEKSERDWWKGKRALPQPSSFSDLVHLPAMNEPYDVYSFHITVPVVIHENQRSSSVFGGLSSLRGPPKYSSGSLLKNDIRGTWSLHPSGTPSTKDEVQLPSGSSSMSVISSKSSKESWCWITEWQIDLGYPRVDSQGWQYAKSFDEPDNLWSDIPTIIGGSGVRRRRWVKVMKRCMEFSSNVGQFLQLVNENNDDKPDYLMRAEAIIKRDQENGKGKGHNELSVNDQLANYKEAINILQNGIKTDINPQRKQESTALMNSFVQHADYLKGHQSTIEPYRLTMESGGGIETPAVPVSPSLHEIPMTPNNISKPPSPIPIRLERPKTPNSNTITSFKAPSTTSFETIESPWSNVVQSEDISTSTQPSVYESSVSPIRVHPQAELSLTNVPAHSLTTPVGKWESDQDVNECRRCRKRFVVCDRCSTARVPLPSSQVLSESSTGNGLNTNQTTQYVRVCDLCFGSSRQLSNSSTSTSLISVGGGSSPNLNSRRLSNSSTMTDCPVCNYQLSQLPKHKQEEHVKSCFEDKNGNSVNSIKYVGEQFYKTV